MHNIESPGTSDDSLEVMIQAKAATAPRVTLEEVNAAYARVMFTVEQRPGGTTSTFVHAFLDGIFYLGSGSSACVSPENFREDIGLRIAKGKAEQIARDKLWELMGFELYQRLKTEAKPKAYTWGDVAKVALQEDIERDAVEFMVSMRDGAEFRGYVDEGSNEVVREQILAHCNKPAAG